MNGEEEDGDGPFEIPPESVQLFDHVRLVDLQQEDLLEVLRDDYGAFPKDSRVLRNTVDLATDELESTAAVLEPYVSTDWADEYQHAFARGFTRQPFIATRIHFFASSDPGPHDQRDLFDMQGPFTQDNYRGYVVLRPRAVPTVSVALLANPFSANPSTYVHCLHRYKSNLLGHSFEILSSPFMEQEGRANVCAEASLWMVGRHANSVGETERLRPTDVLHLATKPFGFRHQYDGLSAEEMFNALRALKLNPDLVYPQDASDALRHVYAWTLSELPVVVGIPDHVVTVIGHRYSAEANGVDGLDDSVAKHVSHLIAHDDAVGPYERLRVYQETRKEDGEQYSALALGEPPGLLGKILNSEIDFVDWVLGPLPPRVRLRTRDAFRLVDQILGGSSNIADVLRADLEGRPASADIHGVVDDWQRVLNSDLVTRIYLRKSSDFKADLRPPRGDPRWSDGHVWRAPEIVAAYWSMELPKFVWVAELALAEAVSGTVPPDYAIVGELLIDSTHPLRPRGGSPRDALLAVHLQGRMLYRLPKKPYFGTREGKRENSLQFIDAGFQEAHSPLVRPKH